MCIEGEKEEEEEEEDGGGVETERKERSVLGVHGRWSEEPRFKLDLFAPHPSTHTHTPPTDLPAPPMSHLHVPQEPRVGTQAGGLVRAHVYVRMCGGHACA